MTNLCLPVSLGEAIDKLTILDIKVDKIKDHRKEDVQKEYDLLYDALKEFIVNYDTLYQTMKKVNLLIWDMMDILRDGNVSEEFYLKKCKECIEYNDVRFRVKNKINNVSGSLLKEQKSYTVNRLIVCIPIVIDNPLLIKIIHYFSFMYDEIIMDTAFEAPLKEHFKYDTTILFKKSECIEYKHKVVIDSDNLLELFHITEEKLNLF